MRVIAEGKEVIVNLWGHPAPQETVYRLMRYLVREDCEDGTLLFNTVTGELVLLSTEESDNLDTLPMPYSSRMDELIARRFLVPDTFDEAKGVNQLRSILRKLTSRKEITGYSILPTSACNARCFYCYESDYPKVSMTSETADKVVEFIAAHCGEKKRVEIQWFGGEPTLGEDRIDQICDGLMERGIDYSSSTLSNGYLFTKGLSHKAKEKWKLQRVQISMDGTEDVYNKAKAYVNADGSPYKRVLENIGHLLDEGIYVIVRMNLSLNNQSDLKALINELIGRYGKSEKFSAYVHEVFDDMGYMPVSYQEEEKHKLISIKVALNQYIADSGCRVLKGIASSGVLPLPSLKIHFCMADNPNSLLINPLGQFGKCDHYSYTHLVGDLENGCDYDAPERTIWMNPIYNEWCEKCFLFPICGRPKFCIGKWECYSEEILDSVKGIKQRMREKLTQH